MSTPGARGDAAARIRSGGGLAYRTWRQLPHERRLAVGAALGLFVALFLPWYQDTVIAGGTTTAANLRSASASITGWGAFSFVEAAVLLVAAGVLVLLYMRAQGRAFHIPGGDGGVIMAAGVWTCVLIVWRIFDKEGTHSNHGLYVTTTGIEWGIFIALGVAGFMVYAGSRIKLAHEPEPPLPGESANPRRSRTTPAIAVPPAEDAATPPARRPRPVGDAGPTPERRPRPADDADPTPERRPRPADDAAPAPTRRPRPAGAAQPPPPRPPVPGAETAGWSFADESATERLHPAQDDAPTQRISSEDGPGQPPAAHRPVEFPDLDAIEIEDPPAARLKRSPPSVRRLPKRDDVPTLPFDQHQD